MNSRRLFPITPLVALALLGLAFAANNLWADAMERITLDKLKATRDSVEALKQDREEVSLESEFQDYRAAMHVHSLLSHDSRSKPEEVAAGAKAAGVKIVMFTEHPAPHYDYFKGGHRRMLDGVLLIPGAEQTGLQLYPQASVPREIKGGPQATVDAVRATKGQTFLCHLEERMDWELDNLTGSEIYNLHADFKDEKNLIKALKNPLGLLTLFPANKQYPQETLAALLDYPADYLKRWDELCRKSKLTGIAANDAHHNQGLRAVVQDDGKVRIEDALGENGISIDADKIPLLIKPLIASAKPGEIKMLLDLDPYERSFKHVSTHLFLKEQTEPEVRAALEAGRAYVSFDWMADPTGFNFQATSSGKVFEMGSDVKPAADLKLRAVSPLPTRFRLIRDGKEVHSELGRKFEYAVGQPGIYRIELWLNLAAGPQIWVLSNPIYVRG
ncbi:MAG: hypothetical protein AB7O26_06640 [Planctomycetaceae bacterium]